MPRSRRGLIAFACALGWMLGPPAGAAQGPALGPCPGIQIAAVPVSFQQLTVSTAAVSLTVPARAWYAVVVLDATNGIRYRADGTAPTATIGTPIGGGGAFAVCGTELGAVQMIRSGAADAIANIHYYGSR